MKTIKKPNFFIVGAPKCGTTSMANWLSEHHRIYMSPIKEPFYFADDLKQREAINSISSLKKYETLYNGVKEDHIAIGEASTNYLFSQTAIKNILEYVSEPKIIVMLRNPVDMVESLHFQQVYSLNETETDFEKAWNLEKSRKNGLNIPKSCIDEKVLYYSDWGSLGEQVQRLSKLISLDKVCFIFMEDLKNNPHKVYEDTLEYLSVPSDGRVNFESKNESKTFKYRWLRHVMRTGVRIKRSLGIYKSLNVEKFINYIPTKRKKMSMEFRETLINEFKDDIILLESLTKRDLSHWLK